MINILRVTPYRNFIIYARAEYIFVKIRSYPLSQRHPRTDPMEVAVDQFETWELEAYAEGVNMPHVQQFVQQHPELWAAWQDQHLKQEHIYAGLTRFDCPSPLQLQKYYWREVSDAEATQIAAHLQQCASCSEEYQSLLSFVDADLLVVESPVAQPVPLQDKIRSLLPKPYLGGNLIERIQDFSERVRTIVAEFVPPLLPEFAPVALRSGDPIPTLDSVRPATLLFTAEESDVSLVAMKEVDGHLFVSGQVLTNEPIESGSVTMTPANQDVAEFSVALDSTGSFLINHLQPGYYFMKISLPAQSIVIPNVLLQ